MKSWPLAVLALALAQSAGGPAFDVASIKPVGREVLLQKGLICGFGAGGRFMAFGWLRYVIACAYEIRSADPRRNIPNGPDWLDVDLFQIDANSPPDHVPRSQSDGLPMLRSLLAERFRLRAHTESRDVPVYALVVARADRRLGPKMLSATHGRGITMAQLAARLSPRVDRPVEDRTKLTGTFDVDLRWMPDPRPPAPDEQRPSFLPPVDPSGSSIFTALIEQLGLKLEPAKGSIEILVIDHVERPSPN
jgi:uncharacterized protein DUF3738